MEKYSQFRDKGTGISPFLPIATSSSAVNLLTHVVLFIFRLPFFVFFSVSYFAIFHHLPLPPFMRKLALWGIMAIPGIWWVDLQLDGVKRGTLADQPPERVPHPGSVIAANFTSPIDAVYLSAVFDPVFVMGYPGVRGVEKVGLLGVAARALGNVRTKPAQGTKLVKLEDIVVQYPERVIAIFPECGTTNGKGIMPLSPCLVETGPEIHIFPVNIRYSPPEVTTPVPGAWFRFLWCLLSRPVTSVRVRVAESFVNTAAATNGVTEKDGALRWRGEGNQLTSEEDKVLTRTGEALARLGRVKRVGLTLEDKEAFVKALKAKKR